MTNLRLWFGRLGLAGWVVCVPWIWAEAADQERAPPEEPAGTAPRVPSMLPPLLRADSPGQGTLGGLTNPFPNIPQASSEGSVASELNPALLMSSDWVANSNLLGTLHADLVPNPAEEHPMILSLARQHRAMKNYGLAGKNYVVLLEGSAPESYKKTALLELAMMAQEQNELIKAQQILAQYIRTYPQDPSLPEVLLRQGILCRQLGAPEMALSKFYAVMTTALHLKEGRLDYYQRLVLHAQAEIADTYLLNGQYGQALEFYRRLLKLEAETLNQAHIRFRLIRCLAALTNHSELIAAAEDYVSQYPGGPEEPEVRFLMARAHKQLGQNQEVLRQVLQLLLSEQAASGTHPERWAYWQQRAGNEIGNQLYLEGDYLSTLEICNALAALNVDPSWRLPVWYQIGLVYERLQQPEKAIEHYRRIQETGKELASNAAPALKTVLDMAKWRMDFLAWQLDSRAPSRLRKGEQSAHSAALAQ